MEKNKKYTEAKEFTLFFLVSLAVAALLIIFVVQTAVVNGTSMFKTLNNNDRLIVEKITYDFGRPKRGDIVVIKYPADTSQRFIKRVIAVGGDKLKIDNGNLYINGKLQKENYILQKMDSPIDQNFKSGVTVPKGTIFVMGDNRNDSHDSRFSDVGFVKLNLVVGKAIFRFYPFDKFGTI